MSGLLHFTAPGNIDITRWDEALRYCYNENPFAYSSWLNLVTPEWGALINEDYSIMMPLPIKKKFVVTYISQPRFTQQLGVFSKNKLSEEMVSQALDSIPKKFMKVHLQLNTDNFFEALNLPGRPTYCIDMRNDYQTLFNCFHLNHKRNIAKARKQSLTVASQNNTAEFIDQFKQTAGSKDISLKPSDFELIHEIMKMALDSGKGEILSCYNEAGELMAGLFYLKSETRIINLFNFSTAPGRVTNAMAFIVDHWINKFANTKFVLDFEGSSISSIATFYSRFGAAEKLFPVFTRKGFW